MHRHPLGLDPCPCLFPLVDRVNDVFGGERGAESEGEKGKGSGEGDRIDGIAGTMEDPDIHIYMIDVCIYVSLFSLV